MPVFLCKTRHTPVNKMFNLNVQLSGEHNQIVLPLSLNETCFRRTRSKKELIQAVPADFPPRQMPGEISGGLFELRFLPISHLP